MPTNRLPCIRTILIDDWFATSNHNVFPLLIDASQMPLTDHISSHYITLSSRKILNIYPRETVMWILRHSEFFIKLSEFLIILLVIVCLFIHIFIYFFKYYLSFNTEYFYCEKGGKFTLPGPLSFLPGFFRSCGGAGGAFFRINWAKLVK